MWVGCGTGEANAQAPAESGCCKEGQAAPKPGQDQSGAGAHLWLLDPSTAPASPFCPLALKMSDATSTLQTSQARGSAALPSSSLLALLPAACSAQPQPRWGCSHQDRASAQLFHLGLKLCIVKGLRA